MGISGCLSRAFSVRTALPWTAHPCPKGIFGFSFDTTQKSSPTAAEEPSYAAVPHYHSIWSAILQEGF